MQSSGQYEIVESTALAKEDRADNSDVPKIQRESIRTKKERLHGIRANIERTPAVGVSRSPARQRMHILDTEQHAFIDPIESS